MFDFMSPICRSSTQSRCPAGLMSALYLAFLLGTPSVHAAVQLPIRIFTPDAQSVTSTSSVHMPAGASAPTALYLKIHNVRNGGMVSVAVNGSAFHNIHNHTVTFTDQDARFGGIGGIHGSLNLFVPISATDVIKPSDVNIGAANEVHIRLNGTDGNVSGIRVLKFNFRDGEDGDLIPATEFTQENAYLWAPPHTDASDIQAGKDLWEGKTKTLQDNPVSGAAINASCASCHFDDGSDLSTSNTPINPSSRARSFTACLKLRESRLRATSAPSVARNRGTHGIPRFNRVPDWMPSHPMNGLRVPGSMRC